MFSRIVEDTMFEIRRHWWRILVPLGLIAVFVLVGVVILFVTWLGTNQAKPPALKSEDIPLGSYTAGNIEVFNCIYQGTEQCPEYERSKEWLSEATESSLTYTPIPGDTSAPGEAAGEGLLRVGSLRSLNEAQWKSLAAGATQNGAANPGTVTEKSATTSSFDTENLSATAIFTVPTEASSAPVVGTMTFTLGNSGVVLKSITYNEDG